MDNSGKKKSCLLNPKDPKDLEYFRHYINYFLYNVLMIELIIDKKTVYPFIGQVLPYKINKFDEIKFRNKNSTGVFTNANVTNFTKENTKNNQFAEIISRHFTPVPSKQKSIMFNLMLKFYTKHKEWYFSFEDRTLYLIGLNSKFKIISETNETIIPVRISTGNAKQIITIKNNDLIKKVTDWSTEYTTRGSKFSPFIFTVFKDCIFAYTIYSYSITKDTIDFFVQKKRIFTSIRQQCIDYINSNKKKGDKDPYFLPIIKKMQELTSIDFNTYLLSSCYRWWLSNNNPKKYDLTNLQLVVYSGGTTFMNTNGISMLFPGNVFNLITTISTSPFLDVALSFYSQVFRNVIYEITVNNVYQLLPISVLSIFRTQYELLLPIGCKLKITDVKENHNINGKILPLYVKCDLCPYEEYANTQVNLLEMFSNGLQVAKRKQINKTVHQRLYRGGNDLSTNDEEHDEDLSTDITSVVSIASCEIDSTIEAIITRDKTYLAYIDHLNAAKTTNSDIKITSKDDTLYSGKIYDELYSLDIDKETGIEETGNNTITVNTHSYTFKDDTIYEPTNGGSNCVRILKRSRRLLHRKRTTYISMSVEEARKIERQIGIEEKSPTHIFSKQRKIYIKRKRQYFDMTLNDARNVEKKVATIKRK